jgi:NADPH-dependent 2,4-dienoyl-CoA reductase/sulfur reductase-like enzyme/rhodanese-related sulfurtransferase
MPPKGATVEKYVIVGGVAGGAGTAARLRRLSEGSQITLFERGDHVSYANCGLPYYAGGSIRDRNALFLMTPRRFKASLNIDALTGHEVVSIDRTAKSVRVRELASGREFDQAYDVLVLAPGAAPIRPPIPGIDDPAVMTLRSVPDADRIKAALDSGAVKRAVVVGGGFIGLEMAENLREREVDVTLVEALDQVMGVLDFEMAAMVQAQLREKGVALKLGDGVTAFERRDGALRVNLKSGASLQADLVVLSIGVRPDTRLAREAGLDLAPNGAIRVDKYFHTSDPSIRAVGDAIEFKNPAPGVPSAIPLAGPANKQARLCAENIVRGDKRPWTGSLGACAAKVFDLTVAAVGASEKALRAAGLACASAIVRAGHHAGYYPGARELCLKLVYAENDGRILGAQCVGADGAVKRVDVISALMGKGGTASDMAAFEQAYAPPYSSARDPVNVAGFIAENAIAGYDKPVPWTDVEAWKARGALLLDVRTPEEFSAGSIEGAVNIPHTELRARLAELPRGRPILVNCAVGLRGYLAERVLRQAGWEDAGNLSGGYRTWRLAIDESRACSKGA